MIRNHIRYIQLVGQAGGLRRHGTAETFGTVIGGDGEKDFSRNAVGIGRVCISKTAGDADAEVGTEGSAAGFRHCRSGFSGIYAVFFDDFRRNALADFSFV